MECGSAVRGNSALDVGRWALDVLTANDFAFRTTVCSSTETHPGRCQFAGARVSQREWRPVFCDACERREDLGCRWEGIYRLRGKLGTGDSRSRAESCCGRSRGGCNARLKFWNSKSVGGGDGGIDLRLDAIDRKSADGEQRHGSDNVVYSPRACVHRAR